MILRNFLFTMDNITVVSQVDLALVTEQKEDDFYSKKNFLFSKKCNDAKLVLQIAWLQNFAKILDFFLQTYVVLKNQYSLWGKVNFLVLLVNYFECLWCF